MRHAILAWLVGVLVYGCLATVLGAAPVDGRVLTTSPEHPRTFWTSGWEQIDHYATWNPEAGALEGHATYGTPSFSAGWWNPAYYDSFKVRFPGVHLNAPEGRLYLVGPHHSEVTIGHLQNGVFGHRVELERNIDLSMHRHDGHLDAALVATPN